MKARKGNVVFVLSFLSVLAACLVIGGCSVKLIADYDATTFEEIIRTGKTVDLFYGRLLETPPEAREYKRFAEDYVKIESDLRSLYIRNNTRTLNAESTRISKIILELWVKYKGKHETDNSYPDGRARLDRDRFTRLFISAANAEAAKRLDADDKDPSKDSK